MKQEELVQKVAATLLKQFRAKDPKAEMRCLIAAEQIVKQIVIPALEERERQVAYLYNSRKLQLDS